jgi:chorismate mutase
MNTEPELHDLRAAMDVVNRRLVDVLHDRARLCRAIAAWKRAHGSPPVDASREQQMLAALLQDAPADGYGPVALARILHEVFTASRQIVQNG